MPTFRDLAGVRFGRLVAIQCRRDGEKWRWLCRCDCGGECEPLGGALTRQHKPTRSCGCLCAEASAAVCRARVKHGQNVNGARWRLRIIWADMVRRCTDPSAKRFDRYGGRGIAVCERWRTFDNFLVDMGEPPSDGHTLERENNDGNYEPANCVWATRKVQTRNTSRTHWVEIQGVRKSLAEWCEERKMNYFTVHSRISKLGMAPAVALGMAP